MVLAQGLGDELPGTPAVTLTARSPKRLFHLVFESHDGRAPGADSEEKHEPVSDIDTVVVDSLKALDPERPIREAAVRMCSNSTPYSIISSAATSRPGGTESHRFIVICSRS